jgi:hypothetical protein
MHRTLLAVATLALATLTVSARASEVTYYIENGVVGLDVQVPSSTLGIFGGYIVVNSATGTIDGGNLWMIDDGQTYLDMGYLPGSEQIVAGADYARFNNPLPLNSPLRAEINLGITNVPGDVPTLCLAAPCPVDPNGFNSTAILNSEVYVHPLIGGTLAATPEPSSLVLLGSGMLSLVGAVRRKRASMLI